MSGSGHLSIPLPNGQKVKGFGLSPDGRIMFLDVNGVYREMHPLVVEAFAKGLVPSGIFMAAFARRSSNDEAVRRLGGDSLAIVDT